MCRCVVYFLCKQITSTKPNLIFWRPITLASILTAAVVVGVSSKCWFSDPYKLTHIARTTPPSLVINILAQFNPQGRQCFTASIDPSDTSVATEVRKHSLNDSKCEDLGWICEPCISLRGLWCLERNAQHTIPWLARRLSIKTCQLKSESMVD